MNESKPKGVGLGKDKKSLVGRARIARALEEK